MAAVATANLKLKETSAAATAAKDGCRSGRGEGEGIMRVSRLQWQTD